MRAVIADVWRVLPRDWLENRKKVGCDRWDEMWDGVLHVPPMPNGRHQDLELDLAAYLKRQWAKPNGCLVRHQVNLTTPEDEATWTKNFRIPDVVLLTPDRFAIDKNEYMAGAPNVVVEIRSPGDETADKFGFYAGLGVPEVWVIDRDSKEPELHVLRRGRYAALEADAGGWLRSPGTGVELRHAGPGQLGLRVNGDAATAEVVPEG
jgi:Uma2 family endonuclease